jgi:hypothetical protein
MALKLLRVAHRIVHRTTNERTCCLASCAEAAGGAAAGRVQGALLSGVPVASERVAAGPRAGTPTLREDGSIAAGAGIDTAAASTPPEGRTVANIAAASCAARRGVVRVSIKHATI